MSRAINHHIGAEFATAKRGLGELEIEFIQRKSLAGVSASNVARMIGRAKEDVTPWMLARQSPAPVVAADPERRPPASRRVRVVQSIWRGLILVPITQDRRTMDSIIGEVATRHGLTTQALKGPSRRKPIVIARQEAMYLMVEEEAWSTTQIGRALGDRDHSTVIYGVRSHLKRLAGAQ
jgi:hypothetical protein